MIKVLFFARLREQLECEQLELEWCEGLSVATLRQRLIEENGDLWQQVLGADNILTAVDQVVVSASHPITDGTEIAFFPPVTGG